MKKFFSIVLAVIMAMSLAACAPAPVFPPASGRGPGLCPQPGAVRPVRRTISEDALFVVDEGQLRCSSCRSSRFELERYGVEIPAQGLDLLRHVQQSFPSGWPDGELPPPVRRACARAIDGFVQYHLGLAWEGNYFRRV